jgi:hypothetical protein
VTSSQQPETNLSLANSDNNSMVGHRNFRFIFCFNDVNMLNGIQLSNSPDLIYFYGPKLNSNKLNAVKKEGPDGTRISQCLKKFKRRHSSPGAIA